MNIGVDTGCLGVKDERLRVGVYQLTFNLLRTLGQIDRKNKYWLYSFAPIPPAVLVQFGPRMKNLVIRPAVGWNYFGLPGHLIFHQPDIFLGPSQSLPYFLPCQGVAIVYDLAFEIFPEFYPDSYRQLRRITCLAIKRAQKIIVVSQSTKKDLIEKYAVPAKKINVFYGSCDSEIFKLKINLSPKNYFLFVGALKKIKNIPGLIHGFRYFLDKTKKDFQLLIVGSDRWLDPEIEKTVIHLGLKKRVVFLGFVGEKNLVKLYREAMAFVSPAFYEGFGLTLVEAMACGCPIVCGNAGSQPEVVKGAGILVDPKNHQEIGEAMLRIITDRQLRQKMVSQGLKRAQFFSWHQFAREVLGVLENL